jgi:exodeoxyribonuclease V beta subunit
MAKTSAKGSSATPVSASVRRWEFLAASAGTGKTEKIQTLLLERLLAPGVLADDVMRRSLLVSFTEAAAAELRSRIQGTLAHVIDVIRSGKTKGVAFRNQQLSQVVQHSPLSDTDKVERLMVAQASIDQLTVGTIHSFCKQVINTYPIECNARTGLIISSDLSEVAAEAAADAYAELVRLYDSQGRWVPGLGDSVGFGGNTLKQPTAQRLTKLAECVVASELPIYPACPVLLPPAGSLSEDYADILTWFAHEIRTRLKLRTQRLGLISLADLIRIVDEALLQTPSPLAAQLHGKWDLIILDEAQDTDAAQWRILQTIAGTTAEFFAVGDPKQSIFSFRGAHYGSLPPLQPGSPWNSGASLSINYRSDKPLLAGLDCLYGNGALHFFSPVTPAHGCRLHNGTVDPANQRSGLYFHIAPGPPDGSFEVRHTWDAIAEAILQELNEGLSVGATNKEQTPLGPGDIAVLVRYNRTAEEIRKALVKRGIPVAAASQASVLDSDELRDLAAVFAAIAAPFDNRLVNTAAMTRIIGFNNADLNRMLLQGDASHERKQLVDRLVSLRESLALEGVAEAFEGIIDHPWPPSGLSARERILQEDDGERAMKNLADIGAVLVKTFWRRSDAASSSLGVSAWLLKASARAAARELGGDEDDTFSVSLETDADAVRVMTVHAAKGRQFGCVWLPEACASFSGTGNRYKDLGQPWRIQQRGEIVLEPGADPTVAKPQAILDSIHEELRLLYVAGTRARHRTHMIVGCFDLPRNLPRLPLGHLIERNQPVDLNVNPPAYLKRGKEKDLVKQLDRMKQAAKANGGVVEIGQLPIAAGNRFTHPSFASPTLPAASLPVPQAMRLSSFSSLSKYAQHGDLQAESLGDPAFAPDDDERTERVKPQDEPIEDSTLANAVPSLAAGGTPLAIPRSVLPGGKRYGDFVHNVLEFMLSIPENFTPADAAAIINSVAEVDDIPGTPTIGKKLAEPLLAALKQPLGGPGFGTLSLLDLAHHGSVTTELPFTVSLDVQSPKAYANLHAVFVKYDTGTFKGFGDLVAQLASTDVRGIFTGFIDLVWRSHAEGRVAVVDYKTNVLPQSGEPALEAYSRDHLGAEMASSRYLLQAAIYAAVVDAWMQSVDPMWDYDSQFAGVSFTFLRAMGPHNPAGTIDNAVFQVVVPKGLARDLAAALRVKASKPATSATKAGIP